MTPKPYFYSLRLGHGIILATMVLLLGAFFVFLPGSQSRFSDGGIPLGGAHQRLSQMGMFTLVFLLALFTMLAIRVLYKTETDRAKEQKSLLEIHIRYRIALLRMDVLYLLVCGLGWYGGILTNQRIYLSICVLAVVMMIMDFPTQKRVENMLKLDPGMENG
jgi:magnesium-transporting ATPase (P-type)